MQVSLTGRNVIMSALSRQVRAVGTFEQAVPIPQGVRGALVLLRVFGVTGTFAGGEGYNLVLATFVNQLVTSNNLLRKDFTKSSALNKNQVAIINPSSSFTSDQFDGAVASNIQFNGPIIGDFLRCRVDISGTFTAGQGVDCDIVVQWLI